jgi:hypothetical protein
MRYEASLAPYFDGARWALPAQPELLKTAATFYETTDLYSVDARAVVDSWAFSTVTLQGRPTGVPGLRETRGYDPSAPCSPPA